MTTETTKLTLVLSVLFLLMLLVLNVNIARAAPLNISTCSFYTNQTTCEQIQSSCQTELTDILIQANHNLSNKVTQCLLEEKTNQQGKAVEYTSIGFAILCLLWAMYWQRQAKK